jgi:hypothetical protein
VADPASPPVPADVGRDRTPDPATAADSAAWDVDVDGNAPPSEPPVAQTDPLVEVDSGGDGDRQDRADRPDDADPRRETHELSGQ